MPQTPANRETPSEHLRNALQLLDGLAVLTATATDLNPLVYDAMETVGVNPLPPGRGGVVQLVAVALASKGQLVTLAQLEETATALRRRLVDALADL